MFPTRVLRMQASRPFAFPTPVSWLPVPRAGVEVGEKLRVAGWLTSGYRRKTRAVWGSLPGLRIGRILD